MSVVVEQPTAHTSLRAEVVEAGERWCNSQRRLIRLVAELDAVRRMGARRRADLRSLGGRRARRGGIDRA